MSLIIGNIDHFKHYWSNTWNSNNTDSCILIFSISDFKLLLFPLHQNVNLQLQALQLLLYLPPNPTFSSVSVQPAKYGQLSTPKQSDFISISFQCNPVSLTKLSIAPVLQLDDLFCP